MASLKSVLITGGSGLIGTRLTEVLLQQGYDVSHLGRSKKNAQVRSFTWDIDQQKIDPAALESVNTIIHLAGAGAAEKRWSEKRKNEILGSRVKATQLLYRALKDQQTSVKTFISASGINFYGDGIDQKVYTESDPPGNGFLAYVCRHWEKEADAVKALGIRVVKFRIGVVLSGKGGALKEIAKPIKLLAGAPLGSGDQYLSWIHIDDLCGIFLKVIEDESLNGVYNAVSPNAVTNRELTKKIAKVLHKPLILPDIPAWALKLLLGEMASMVLNGKKISSEKIEKAGYQFRFTSLEKALRDLLT